MADLTTSVALNTTFSHLNDDRSLAVKPNAASREREAVCDITFDDGDYAAGGPIVNFSTIRGFTKVYTCEVLHASVGALFYFTPGAGDDAALGKLKCYVPAIHTHGILVTGGGTIQTNAELGLAADSTLVKVEAGDETIVGTNGTNGVQNNAVALMAELAVGSTLLDSGTVRVRIRGI